MIGHALGPYQVLSKLGVGGMGEVYRARDTRLNRDVAIKVLPPSFADDPDRRARFEREAQAVAALSHPNIIAIFDTGVVTDAAGLKSGPTYVVTELLDGETLRDRLQAGALPVKKAVDIAVQIARGLAAAHDKHLVHRDLKPENVFLLKDGQVKILDFGIARQAAADSGATETVAAITDPGIIMGTVGYMAPEQVRGQAVDARADLFAFGAVLYEMVSGQPAFRRDTAADTMTAILREDPPDLAATRADLPPPLDRIIRHCLEKNANERFQTSRDISFALEALSGSSTAPSGGASVAAPQPPRWSRTAKVAVVAAAFVAAALGAFAYGRSSVAPPAIPEITLKTFDRQTVFNARFLRDGQTIVFSAALTGNVPSLFVLRPGTLRATIVGEPGTHLLAVSSNDELAVLTGARYMTERLFSGRLAKLSLEGAPTLLRDDVREADFGPKGELAVAHDMGTGDRLEYPEGYVLYERPGGYVSDLRVSPDGNRVAFMDHVVRFDNRGFIRVVDRQRKVTTLAGEFWGAEGLAWSADGRTVLFGASKGWTGDRAAAGNWSYRIWTAALADPGVSRVALAGALNYKLFDTAADGRWLATREEERWGIRISLPGEAGERDLSWLDATWAPYLSHDGKWLLFTDGRAGPEYGLVVRATNGGAPASKGEGNAMGFSPDERWVLAHIRGRQQLALYPVGTGEPVALPRAPLESIQCAGWFADSKSLLILGNEPSKRRRLYRQFLDGSPPRPLLAEGIEPNPKTPYAIQGAIEPPDGRRILAADSTGTWSLYPIDGHGQPQVVPGLSPLDFVLGWTGDRRSVFVTPSGYTIPLRVELVNVTTGQRELFKEYAPPDRTSLIGMLLAPQSANGLQYAYEYRYRSSALFVVSEGK